MAERVNFRASAGCSRLLRQLWQASERLARVIVLLVLVLAAERLISGCALGAAPAGCRVGWLALGATSGGALRRLPAPYGTARNGCEGTS